MRGRISIVMVAPGPSFLKIIPISSEVYFSRPAASNNILLTGNWYNLLCLFIQIQPGSAKFSQGKARLSKFGGLHTFTGCLCFSQKKSIISIIDISKTFLYDGRADTSRTVSSCGCYGQGGSCVIAALMAEVCVPQWSLVHAQCSLPSLQFLYYISYVPKNQTGQAPVIKDPPPTIFSNL